MAGRVHVVGAGLAGLAAAVALRGKADISLHEAGPQAGGRCRSYRDEGLDAVIDNGNHLILSGNHATLRFAQMIGAQGLESERRAEFRFVDIKTGERWTVRPNRGLAPWWIFCPSRRAPGTTAGDYLRLGKLLAARKNARLGDVIPCSGVFFERFLQPVLTAALNTEPAASSAMLARRIALATLGRGACACRPIVAREGLSRAFIDPAIRSLEACGAEIRFNHRLRRVILTEQSVGALDFSDELVLLGPHDVVILAAPGPIAAGLLPHLRAPLNYNAIVNAHFMTQAPPDFPRMVGVVNGVTEWIFAFPGRVSVTISDANRFLDKSKETLARTIWSEVANLTGLPDELPAWRIIKEKRATFAATPDQNARRPPTRTRWSNLFLAGDWTDTGLPATIEGAIRSGGAAARLALSSHAQRKA